MDPFDWSPLESIEEATESRIKTELERKEAEEYKKRYARPLRQWVNLECMEAYEKANNLLKKLSEIPIDKGIQ